MSFPYSKADFQPDREVDTDTVVGLDKRHRARSQSKDYKLGLLIIAGTAVPFWGLVYAAIC